MIGDPHVDKYVMPEPMSGCWLWLGAVDRQDYGFGWDRALKRTVRAHRLVYELLVGPIPSDKKLLHRCDNPCCVNPDHMFIGTVADNKRDSVNKKRHAHGEQHGMNKIAAERALEIRDASGSHREIAAKFGVSKPLVTKIKAGHLWKHLEVTT